MDGSTLLSEEGTTQGHPLAMPMYAMATIPLINQLGVIADVKQAWYADDATAAGSLYSTRRWWNQLVPPFGYHANASKTWLLTKEEHLDRALSDIAKSQPHAAHAAFTHGYAHKFSFLCRTIPNIEGHLHPLEKCIRSNFIPSLTSRSPPNDLERDLLGLPPRLGGLGITNPTMLSSRELEASKSISAPLSNLIEEQWLEYPYECIEAQITAKKAVHQQRRNDAKESASTIREKVPEPLQRAMDRRHPVQQGILLRRSAVQRNSSCPLLTWSRPRHASRLEPPWYVLQGSVHFSHLIPFKQ